MTSVRVFARTPGRHHPWAREHLDLPLVQAGPAHAADLALMAEDRAAAADLAMTAYGAEVEELARAEHLGTARRRTDVNPTRQPIEEPTR